MKFIVTVSLKNKVWTWIAITIEGYNSRIRHYLARLKRKGKCYSKCTKMIENSLNLLFANWNGKWSYV